MTADDILSERILRLMPAEGSGMWATVRLLSGQTGYSGHEIYGCLQRLEFRGRVRRSHSGRTVRWVATEARR